ncbi:MAG: 1-acyl-sn-glycerol-3-phosphate acyltransferase [Synechococcales cyanobacterium CRU_2_2]|nr:1-acyl-sn-glycerol-3-phosphate acyltransferase [Synechococcales cyanobacterium CRU_2_2]
MASDASAPGAPALTTYRDREPWHSLALYRLFKWSIIVPAFYTYFKGRIEGLENVPKHGPFIAVSNHASDFDPPLLAASLGRPVAFMAKEELFDVPLLKQGIQLYGAYPVRRGTGDRQALKAAMSFLEQGWGAGLFLDGTRTPDGRIADPKPGAAWIAAKMQVPLVPVCLWGTQNILIQGKGKPQSVPITVRIGKPIPAPASSQRDLLVAVTQECADAIHAMHDLGR